MISQPSESGTLFSIFIVSLQTKQLNRSISGLLSSFKSGSSGTRAISSPSFSLRLHPWPPGPALEFSFYCLTQKVRKTHASAFRRSLEVRGNEHPRLSGLDEFEQSL